MLPMQGLAEYLRDVNSGGGDEPGKIVTGFRPKMTCCIIQVVEVDGVNEVVQDGGLGWSSDLRNEGRLVAQSIVNRGLSVGAGVNGFDRSRRERIGVCEVQMPICHPVLPLNVFTHQLRADALHSV